MSTVKYTVSTAIEDDAQVWYPSGPGPAYGCYSGTCYPHSRFATSQLALRAARCMNDAYAEGYNAAQREMRKALGIL